MISGKSGATSQAQYNEADWRLPYVEGPDRFPLVSGICQRVCLGANEALLTRRDSQTA